MLRLLRSACRGGRCRPEVKKGATLPRELQDRNRGAPGSERPNNRKVSFVVSIFRSHVEFVRRRSPSNGENRVSSINLRVVGHLRILTPRFSTMLVGFWQGMKAALFFHELPDCNSLLSSNCLKPHSHPPQPRPRYELASSIRHTPPFLGTRQTTD
jgi:hypothetical protein